MLAHLAARQKRADRGRWRYNTATMFAPIPLIEKRLAEIRHVEDGLTKLRAGDSEAALAEFSAAHALNPTADKSDLIARCHHRAGRLDQAIALLERLAAEPAKAGKRLAAAERGLLYALRDAGRWEEAEQVADRMLARFAASPSSVAAAMLAADMPLAFPGWMRFFDKGALADSLSRWHAAHPHADRFWPESFLLPRDTAALTRFRALSPPGVIFVVKPTASSGGKGVRLTRDPTVAAHTPMLVQRHVDDPFLIDGKKFHVRLYVLVSALAEPRAYLYREGILRLAPEPYAIDDASLARPAIHVTNTALHQRHPALALSGDGDNEDDGNIRSLSALLRRLAAAGLDAAESWERLADLARRLLALIVESGLFRDQAASHGRHCFPPLLFGLDVLIDASGRPWLIECQRSPAVAGTALVNRINAALFETVFRMSVYRLAAPGDSGTLGDARHREAAELAAETSDIGRFQRLL
jgi:tetratricopeptide (TPR) repeat protein